MKKMDWTAIILSVICALLINGGQVFWKLSINQGGGLPPFQGSDFFTYLKFFITPYMIIGTILYLVANGFWIYLLGKYELSYIYPTLAVTYIFSTFFSYFVFNETIGFLRIIGIILIIAGVYVINLSR
jgi:drug/metabolite transporter (DMT)-like permease